MDRQHTDYEVQRADCVAPLSSGFQHDGPSLFSCVGLAGLFHAGAESAVGQNSLIRPTISSVQRSQDGRIGIRGRARTQSTA